MKGTGVPLPPGEGSSYKRTTEGGHDIVVKRLGSAIDASDVSKGTMWGTVW